MEIAANCCRLCFTKAVRPINIFGEAATSLNVVDALAQFFRDQVRVNVIYAFFKRKTRCRFSNSEFTNVFWHLDAYIS